MKTELSDAILNFDVTNYTELLDNNSDKEDLLELIDILISFHIETDILHMTPEDRKPHPGHIVRCTPNIFTEGYEDGFYSIIIDNKKWLTKTNIKKIERIIDKAFNKILSNPK